MAIVWAEGFDQYGGDESFMSVAGYSLVSNFGGFGMVLSNTNPRTGIWSMHFLTCNLSAFRRILDTAQPVVGVSVGLRQNTAPQLGNSSGIRFECQATGDLICRIQADNLLRLVAVNAAGTIIGASNNNAVPLGSWNWIEVKLTLNAVSGLGDIVVYLNNVPCFSIINAVLGHNLTDAVCIGSPGGNAAGCDYQIDDLIIWDGTGAQNNDFLGERRCVTLFPSADGTTVDWIPSAGSAWQCVDETPPSTADYISTSVVGDVAEFQKPALNLRTNTVAAVRLVAYGEKDDVGAAVVRLGMHSGGAVGNSAPIALTPAYTYIGAILELDPNGNIPWTRAAVDAAQMRITRDA